DSSGPQPPAEPPITLAVNPAALEPLITATVLKTLERFQSDQARLGDRLAYSEPEAARLLGLLPHQLRDERLRGRIAASQVVGRRVRYLRQDLLDSLAAHRLNEP